MAWGDKGSVTSYTDKVDSEMLSDVGNTDSQKGDANSILNMYSQFTQLRNNYDALAMGKMTPHDTYNQSNTEFKNIAAWYMTYNDEKLLVIHNISEAESVLIIKDVVKAAIGVNGTILSSDDDSGNKTLEMGAYSTVVFEL